MRILIGDTGFVGSNICSAENFDGLYHSANIEQAFGTKPSLLVYAGLHAEKYLANHDPQRDLNTIFQAYDNIYRIAPKKVVLISTVDVYRNPVDVYEDTLIETEGLSVYGFNRYRLEEMVRQLYADALIVRLPGLYGNGLKKNFLYDIVHRIPAMLDGQKYETLSLQSAIIAETYHQEENGYYKVQNLALKDKIQLRKFFKGCGFSAINFTDSRSIFQFYPLRFLWQHIQSALNHDIRCLNIAVEPIKAQDIYNLVEGVAFCNELPGTPADYRMRTRFDSIFDSKNGYIFDRSFLLQDIESFIRDETAKSMGEDE